MESRTDPMAPNTIGDDSNDAEIAGEQEPLKMYEDGDTPPPGALDTAFPDTNPAEDPRSDPGMWGDPGRVPGSRDPDLPNSSEDDDTPGPKEGGTPYDAEGSSGSGGQ